MLWLLIIILVRDSLIKIERLSIRMLKPIEFEKISVSSTI